MPLLSNREIGDKKMSEATDFEIRLLEKVKEFTNSKTGEKFKTSTLDGYVTYKGNPILKANGRRMEDRTYNSKKTGKPFTVKKYALHFLNGEDYKDEDLKEDGTLFLKMDERVTRKDNSPFSVLRTDSHWFGKDDERSTDGFRVGNMIIALNGIIETRSIRDQFDDEARRVKLTVNDYAIKYMAADLTRAVEERVGYTLTTKDEMFPDEVLLALKEQFKYFDNFNRAFLGEESKPKEKVVPASF